VGKNLGVRSTYVSWEGSLQAVGKKSTRASAHKSGDFFSISQKNIGKTTGGGRGHRVGNSRRDKEGRYLSIMKGNSECLQSRDLVRPGYGSTSTSKNSGAVHSGQQKPDFITKNGAARRGGVQERHRNAEAKADLFSGKTPGAAESRWGANTAKEGKKNAQKIACRTSEGGIMLVYLILQRNFTEKFGRKRGEIGGILFLMLFGVVERWRGVGEKNNALLANPEHTIFGMIQGRTRSTQSR
jgi:hypothetical protein